MFNFYNTCSQRICRDCCGNIRVNNAWNSCNGCGCWNNCNSCNNVCNTTCNNSAANDGVNGTCNATPNYSYGCVRVCGYNVASQGANESSGCWANRCRRYQGGCSYNG